MSEAAVTLGAPRAGNFPAERRAWVRYPCSLDVFCQLPAQAPPLDFMASTRNVSSHGVELLVQRQLKRGAFLSVEVFTPAGCFTDPRAAWVVHATAQQEGGWLVGCAWVRPLGEAELRALAGPAPDRPGRMQG